MSEVKKSPKNIQFVKIKEVKTAIRLLAEAALMNDEYLKKEDLPGIIKESINLESEEARRVAEWLAYTFCIDMDCCHIRLDKKEDD